MKVQFTDIYYGYDGYRRAEVEMSWVPKVGSFVKLELISKKEKHPGRYKVKDVVQLPQENRVEVDLEWWSG